MRKRYVYKMQWLFNNNKGDLNNCISVVRAIGSKSLTVINFRDENYKIIDSYSRMVMFGYPTADKETVKAIRKACKNENVKSIELLRK